MIDLHTHLLPEVDDGSDSLEESASIIAQMLESGVSDIVLTPHFVRGLYQTTYALKKSKLEQLNSFLHDQALSVNIILGAEIYLEPDIWREIEEEHLEIAGTDYLLVETGLYAFPGNLYEILSGLLKRGFKPILAHPERYADIVRQPQLAEDLIQRDIILQANSGSFLGYYGREVQKTVWEMIKNRFIHLIASDTHHIWDSYPGSQAASAISKYFNNDLTRLLMVDNPRNILSNRRIELSY
ncbi:MAG: hypothetical protein JW784_05430 [Candidatus Cloacimonetes bacterium]|nr:hypothetical protein [Candidatus Cloacimonadota bacterium]